MMRILSVVLAAFLLAPALGGLPEAAAETRQRALLLSDGTIRVGVTTVRLAYIYLPPTNRQCETFRNPVRCASRGLLALGRRLDRFVTCDYLTGPATRPRLAYCNVLDRDERLGPRVDLGAWLIDRGWAVALPGAPFEYHLLERLARHHNRGIWGFQVDSVTFR